MALSAIERKGLPALTQREVEIVQLVWAASEIAKHIKISRKTVDTHRANIMKKYRARNVATMLRTAIEAKVLRVQ